MIKRLFLEPHLMGKALLVHRRAKRHWGRGGKPLHENHNIKAILAADEEMFAVTARDI